MSNAIEAAMEAFAYVAHDLTPEQYRENVAAATYPAAKRALDKSRAAMRAAIAAYQAKGGVADPVEVMIMRLDQQVREEIMRSAATFRPDELALSVAAIFDRAFVSYDSASPRTAWKLAPIEATEEMIDAARHFLEPATERIGRATWAAMLAAAPTHPKPDGIGVKGLEPAPVGVKPLEWEQISRVPDVITFKAESIVGAYLVWGVTGGQWTYSSMLRGFKAGFLTAEAAKAAAQADYEARIRSALTSPASGERDSVIEVTDAMVEDGAVAIDALWSEGQDRGPAFAETEREYQAHCRSTARAALIAALRMEGK